MFNLTEYVKPPTLQIGGNAVALLGLLAHAHWFGLPLAFIGVLGSAFGYFYGKFSSGSAKS